MPSKTLSYEQYGAAGDGVTDDLEAIARTHAAANKLNMPVCASPGAVYYIGGKDMTAEIQTDTNWGTAKFIIDDTNVENRKRHIFRVTSKLAPIQIAGIASIKKGQSKLDISLAHDSLVTAFDNTTMHYIREGLNQDSGTQQTDVFIVRKNGHVDPSTAILWDYHNISSLVAHPIPTQPLVISGGHFTTIANHETAEYNYFERNIALRRSNIIVDGLTHVVTEENPDHSAPYSGFISIDNCADITVRNCNLSAHKIYTTIGAAGKPVKMGSYDILANRSVNLLFKDCRQLNDITDDTTWGIFGSNFTKNITFDTVSFSRFDAHKGTTNTIIKNSEIGHMGIQLIGSGICHIENTKVYGSQFANLRGDYGSTWEGELVILNCEFTPHKLRENGALVLGAYYTGLHDFGYTCYMPQKITIDGLVINDDRERASNYQGPRVLSSVHPNYADRLFKEKYHYVLPEEVIIRNVTVKSGKPWVLSDNMDLFREVACRGELRSPENREFA